MALPFIIMSTAHWNWDCEDCNPEEWLKLETEYHEKVTMENELIAGSGVLTHYFSEDNSEVIFVTVYNNWDDIDDAAARNAELEEAAWPDEDEREAANKARARYYSSMHSDEIYRGAPFGKWSERDEDDEVGEPLVVYRQTRKLAFPESGTMKESLELHREFFEHTWHKNDHALAVFVHRHAWGSDGRDMDYMIVAESMSEVEAALDKQSELIEAHWTDEDERKAFMQKMNKYYEPMHSDYVYRTVPELMK